MVVIAWLALVTWCDGVVLADPHYPVSWIQQAGTTGREDSFGVVTDSWGNVFISGWSTGDIGGPNAGSRDAFVAKFDPLGALAWVRQLGTAGDDRAFGVAVDVLGNVLVTGYTDGGLSGTHSGGYDAFVTKFDGNGSLAWTRQLGTAGDEFSRVVATDTSGNVLIAGRTTGSLGGANAGLEDAFVAKYSPEGGLVWTRQFGTASTDYAFGIGTDEADRVFITGDTSGSLAGSNAGGADVFVTVFDAGGTRGWTRQLGSSATDSGRALAVDLQGNVLVTGFTTGSLVGLNGGQEDVFIVKFDQAGNLIWQNQIGTAEGDFGYGVAADGSGNVFLTGYTSGSLGGQNAGGFDVFVTKIGDGGATAWTRQLGTSAADEAFGVAVDATGNVLVTGHTLGTMSGSNAGTYDAFVFKLEAPAAPVPEPTGLALMSIGAVMLLRRRRR